MMQFEQRDPHQHSAITRVEQACHKRGFGSIMATEKFQAAIARFDEAHPNHYTRDECLNRLADVFVNFIEAEQWRALNELAAENAMARGEPLNRLRVGSAVSELLLISKVSQRERSLREDIVVGVMQALFATPLYPTEEGTHEVQNFLKHAPSFIDRLVTFERARSEEEDNGTPSSFNARSFYRIVDFSVANLCLMVAHNMPAQIAMKATEAMLSIESDLFRGRIARVWQSFASRTEFVTYNSSPRLPEPIGRPALMGAIKSKMETTKYYGVGTLNSDHSLSVEVPHKVATWRYFAQRLNALTAIKDPKVRGERIGRYVLSFCENVAAERFYEREENYFRQVNLDGESTPHMRHFYREVYGVDNGPGPEDSLSAETPLKETAEAFRIMASARYGLNVRKGYARSLQTKKWLLEHMAEELKGESKRYKVADIEAYPGPGVRISNLDVRNALDLSTSETRLRHLRASPWIATSMRHGKDVEYHLFRGFKAITRSLDAAAHSLSSSWPEQGMINGKPYSAIIFNDHFHNNRLPEVRMWLVPEWLLHRKLMFAIENKVDVNQLDVTPEGLAEEAEALKAPIFDVGCSCVRWGGFANAWPHATGPAHSWESDSEWLFSKWQSPRHIHRALREENYRTYLTREVAQVMATARVEHDKLKYKVQFFLDLHSSFLTMEEAWAKGYAIAGESPAREEPSREESQSSGFQPPDQADLGGGSSSDPFSIVERRPRTRMLEHFLELRNMVARSGRDVSPKDFPTLELQYTRLFSRQAGTPYISGADMVMRFPDGKQMPMVPGKGKSGVLSDNVEMNERMEAMWDEYVVSQFAPNNCPRVILP